jgi:GDP-4-dehydro-6-deoxy-D-mannose reductase
MPAPALVTGASGFAGSHLLDLLTRQGIPVVGWHRPGATPAARTGVTWVPVDLLDRTAVRRAVEQVLPSAVYHCAGSAHVGQSWTTSETTFAVNVLGTHHLVESLRRTDPTIRFLIPSSAMVYAASNRPLSENDPLIPASPYAVSKLAQEMTGGTNPGGPTALVARAFNHLGPRQGAGFSASAFARRIAEIELTGAGGELSVGNLEAQRDLTDVRDTVRAYQLIVERGVAGRAYNVCSGRAVAIGDLLDRLRARARVPIHVVVDPARYRPNDLPLVVGNPSRIRDELGWQPEIPLEQTLDDLLNYWRDTLGA